MSLSSTESKSSGFLDNTPSIVTNCLSHLATKSFTVIKLGSISMRLRCKFHTVSLKTISVGLTTTLQSISPLGLRPNSVDRLKSPWKLGLPFKAQFSFVPNTLLLPSPLNERSIRPFFPGYDVLAATLTLSLTMLAFSLVFSINLLPLSRYGAVSVTSDKLLSSSTRPLSVTSYTMSTGKLRNF